MLTRDDIFVVQVTDEMVSHGVAYAEKSLHYTYNRMGSPNLYDRARRIVSGIIVEQSFKRLLDHHKVKFDLLGNTHWTKKDRYDVGMNGHRYDVKGFFVHDPARLKSITQDKGWFLDCCALVPADQVAARSLAENDAYVFPFLTGRVMTDVRQAYDMLSEGEYKHLVHFFWDYDWIKNEDWKSQGQLTLESRMESEISLRLGGQGEDEELVVENVRLRPGEKYVSTSEFFTTLFIQTLDTPLGDLIVKAAKIGKSERIRNIDWGNIWVYNGSVYLTGYMSKGEFKAKSKAIPRFYKGCKQYGDTKTDNRMLLIRELYSLKDLLPKN